MKLIRCSHNIKENFKSEIILNRSKPSIAKKRELENSQVPEMLRAKNKKFDHQVYFRKNK